MHSLHNEVGINDGEKEEHIGNDSSSTINLNWAEFSGCNLRRISKMVVYPSCSKLKFYKGKDINCWQIWSIWHSWIRASWYSFYKMTNKMQLCRIIYCSLTALHVSSDIFAHHQEHINCNYSSFLFTCVVVGCCHGSSRQWRSTINYSTQLHLVGHFVKIYQPKVLLCFLRISSDSKPNTSVWKHLHFSFKKPTSRLKNLEKFRCANSAGCHSGTEQTSGIVFVWSGWHSVFNSLDVTSCRLVNIYWSFGVTCCLHLQCQAVHEHPKQTIMGFESPSRHFNELRVSHKTNDFFFFKRRWSLEVFITSI